MSTFMANKANIERKWYVLDAAGKPLGKTAVRAADLLRGKGKVTFTPHADCGDNVTPAPHRTAYPLPASGPRPAAGRTDLVPPGRRHILPR